MRISEVKALTHRVSDGVKAYFQASRAEASPQQRYPESTGNDNINLTTNI